MQAVGSGIEAAIEGDRAGTETLRQIDRVSAVGDQATLPEILEHVHRCGSKFDVDEALKAVF
jgi:hypothetical protein